MKPELFSASHDIDRPARKQQFAHGARAGDLARGGEIVDLALLDAQQLGKFLGGEVFAHRVICAAVERSNLQILAKS